MHSAYAQALALVHVHGTSRSQRPTSRSFSRHTPHTRRGTRVGPTLRHLWCPLPQPAHGLSLRLIWTGSKGQDQGYQHNTCWLAAAAYLQPFSCPRLQNTEERAAKLSLGELRSQLICRSIPSTLSVWSFPQPSLSGHSTLSRWSSAICHLPSAISTDSRPEPRRHAIIKRRDHDGRRRRAHPNRTRRAVALA